MKNRFGRAFLVASLSVLMVLGSAPAAFASGGSWRGRESAWWYEYTDGGYATGWERVGGKWYHFTGSGWMQTGWVRVGGAWYYLAGSGAMKTGWQKLGGTWYYLKSSGAMAEGWQRVGGAWYYLSPGSGAIAIGWKKVGGVWYYLDASGAMRTGWQWIDGEYYYLEPSGAMVANRWVGNYYVGSTGAMLRSQWVGRYYVGADGAWIPNCVAPAKPADPTRPGVVQAPTSSDLFTYAVGDYIEGAGNSPADVKSGMVDASQGAYASLPGGGFEVVSSGGFTLSRGYACGHGVYITGYKGASGTSVVVPDAIGGIPVVYANVSEPSAVSADPRWVLSQVDATQAKHLRWLSVGGAPQELYCQGATSLSYLSSRESALLPSFDGSSLSHLEVLDFGALPHEFSLSTRSLVSFSAQYQATDRVIPYLDFAHATNLETLSIARRGANVAEAGPLTAAGYTLEGCSALTTVELPFQSLTTFDPYALPSLETLVLTGNPLTAQARATCESWAQETGGSLSLSL